MKKIQLLTTQALSTELPEAQNPLPFLSDISSEGEREILRHILLGSPNAVRQTIHLLHSLHYAETILWSPVMTVEEEIIITPAQGEAMSLLRRQL